MQKENKRSIDTAQTPFWKIMAYGTAIYTLLEKLKTNCWFLLILLFWMRSQRSTESHMTKNQNLSPMFREQEFILQNWNQSNFCQAFQKLHSRGRLFNFVLVVVAVCGCLATSNETPKCEKDHWFCLHCKSIWRTSEYTLYGFLVSITKLISAEKTKTIGPFVQPKHHFEK